MADHLAPSTYWRDTYAALCDAIEGQLGDFLPEDYLDDEADGLPAMIATVNEAASWLRRSGTVFSEPHSNNPGFERLVDDYGDSERRAGDYYTLGEDAERDMKGTRTVSRNTLLTAHWTVERERDEAQKWLREHGEHRPSCDRAGGNGVCDCGLDRAAGRGEGLTSSHA